MPKVQVNHHSSKDAIASLKTIQEFFENDADLRKLDSDIQCQFDSTGLRGQVKGSQFKADIQVKTNASGCDVQVVVDLPLLLTPFKGKVEEVLKKKLAKHLA